jgi:uncharacterized membrane protein
VMEQAQDALAALAVSAFLGYLLAIKADEPVKLKMMLVKTAIVIIVWLMAVFTIESILDYREVKTRVPVSLVEIAA